MFLLSQADMNQTIKDIPFSFCHAELPKAGLGNKLFVWAKALAFARLNELPLVVSGWTQFQLSPILRGGDFRFYWNYFRPVKEVHWLKQAAIRRRAKIVEEPPVVQLERTGPPAVYKFSKVPHWSDSFGELKPHRELIRAALFQMLTPARRREFEQAAKPKVCIQVRMGDFQRLKPGADFSKAGNTRTPLGYFTNIIRCLRAVHGSQIPIAIVSDGRRNQLQELLKLPAVELAARQTAIVDILRMSRSKILVPSSGSSFGYWAGFLGDSAILMHPDHIHKSIRPEPVNELFYEGPTPDSSEQWPELLKANIASI
jgi:hypothetical protein